MSEIKFEEALKKLERIVSELEKGDLPLDDSLKKYEDGVKLASICTKKLELAQRKVELLTKDSAGRIRSKSFEEDIEDVDTEDSSRKKKIAKKTKEDEKNLF